MIQSWLELAWHFVFGWAGVDMLIGFAAVAVAVFETWIINSIPPPLNKLIPDLRKWAICTAIVAFTLTGSIAYGYRNGSNEVKRQWDAALVKEVGNGNQILQDAERDSVRDTPDSVRNDRWNRDKWKLRGSK